MDRSIAEPIRNAGASKVVSTPEPSWSSVSDVVARFHSHPLHQTLEDVRQGLDQFAGSLLSLPDGSAFQDRAQQTCVALSESLNAAEPGLVPLAVLDSINSALASISNEIKNFNSDKSTGHLQIASSNLDQILQAIPVLRSPRTPKDLEGIGKSAGTLRRNLSKYLAEARTEVDSFEGRIGDLQKRMSDVSTAIDSSRSRVETLLDQVQNNFAQAEIQRTGQAAQAEKQRSEQFQGLATRLEERIRSVEETSRADVAKAFQKFQEDLASERKAAESSAKMVLDATGARADEVLEQLNRKNQEAQKLVHAIGSTGLTGAYQQVANKANKEARYWQWAALGSLMGLVAIGGWQAFDQRGTSFEWLSMFSRWNILIPLLLLAGYTAGQARRLQRIEDTNRRIEIQLASVDPFLANLPEPAQQQIKALLVPHFFGKEDGTKGSTKSADFKPITVASEMQNLLRPEKK